MFCLPSIISLPGGIGVVQMIGLGVYAISYVFLRWNSHTISCWISTGVSTGEDKESSTRWEWITCSSRGRPLSDITWRGEERIRPAGRIGIDIGCVQRWGSCVAYWRQGGGDIQCGASCFGLKAHQDAWAEAQSGIGSDTPNYTGRDGCNSGCFLLAGVVTPCSYTSKTTSWCFSLVLFVGEGGVGSDRSSQGRIWLGWHQMDLV